MQAGGLGVSLEGMRAAAKICWFTCLLTLLSARTLYAAPSSGDEPLSGVPIALDCQAMVPPDHPLLDSHQGVDLELLRGDDSDGLSPAQWLENDLCGRLLLLLMDAGAHPSPDDLKLPARATLRAILVDAYLEGTRVVEQRIQDNLWPVSVPHWSLEMTWRIRFSVRYGTGVQGPGLDLVLRGVAHQQDYQKLDLALLLSAATTSALSRLPRVLADEGHLGELLFTMAEVAPRAPDSWGVSGTLSESFGLLLSTTTSTRHGALAIYLSSSHIHLAARRSLARWFVINEPEAAIRRDALSWLMRQEASPGSGEALSDEVIELIAWLLHRATSYRIRAAAIAALAGREGSQVRRLLVVAAADADPRVADVALSQLKNFKAATARELGDRGNPTAPSLPAWTASLDGRLGTPDSGDQQRLLTLADTAGGAAAELWLGRWLRSGKLAPDDAEWVLLAWQQLSGSEVVAVRKAALQRLVRERQHVAVAGLIAARAEQETDPELLVLALGHLDDGPRELNLLLSASSGPDPLIRRAAAAALASQSASAAELRLRTLSREDPKRKVRAAARKALRKRRRGKN